MPRPRTKARTNLIPAAMQQFWTHGYAGSSMDALVKATGVSRHGIYQDAGGKAGLFLKAMEIYRDTVVSAAFAGVEADGAGFADIRAYLDYQITLAEQVGLPGPGCLIANTMTEPAALNADVSAAIAAHLARLTDAVAAVLAREAPDMPQGEAHDRAQAFVTALQGLWAVSRQTTDAARLRRTAAQLMTLLERP